MSNVFGRRSRVMVEWAAATFPTWSHRLPSYGLALLLVAAAATLPALLPKALGPTPFLAFYLAWVGAAAFGGLGPGLLATAASWLCVDLLFDSTPWQMALNDPVALGRMAVLLAGGLVVSLIAGRTRRARLLERRQTSEVARAKQEWERTFDAVPDLIAIIDRQYRILRVNRAMAERVGAPPERFIGLTCYQCIHDLKAPPAVCPHAQCMADGRTHAAEVYEERSGSYFLVTCTPLLDPDGQWIGSVHVARDITERKRAEEDLKRSESILAQAGEVAHLGAWEIEFTASDDINRSPLHWSDEVYRIFGYAPHSTQISNDLFFRHVHPEDRRRVADAVAQAIAEKRPYQIEHRIVRADGAERIVLEHAEIKFDSQGRPRQMIGAVQDITERRQADRALRESEERLGGIVNSAMDAIISVNEQQQIVLFNPAAEKVFGHRATEMIGQPLERLIPERFRRAHEEHIRRYAQTGVTTRQMSALGEIRGLRATGAEFPIEASISQITVAGGKLFTVILRDITERKQAEEALRESERRFKSTFENAAVGITHVGLDGKFLRFNDRFCEITGYSHEALATKSFQEITQPDDLAAELRLRQRLLWDEIDHYMMDKRYVRADGSVVWVSLTVSVQQEQGHPPEYFIAIVQDVSQRKQMEEMLRDWNATLETKVAQRTAELEQRARQLQRLTLELSEAEDRERQRLAEILHDDLQQVLAAAKFQLGRLRSRAQQDSAQQTATAQIEHLLKEAIEKSRSLSHELSPALLRHGDFGETLRWLAEQVQTKHGLTVRVQAAGGIDLQSDALKAFLYKASQETLFNVVKHAGVHEAQVRVRRLGRYVGLSVSDRGRGFDPQEVKATAGFGLLSIRERLELLGGRLKIKSAKGRGSTFFLIVPDGEKPEDRRQTTDDTRQITVGVGPRAYPSPVIAGSHGGLPLRVLLADDHEIVRQGLISVLGDEQGIEIVGQAGNGREAVELAERLEPDVVVMDVSMPVMTGEEATRQIKRRRPQTRIIALSMHDEAQVRRRMRSAGATAYLLKTAPSEELLAAIREN